MANQVRSPPPVDRGWAWMISVGFFLYVFFMVGLAKSFGLILMELIKEFHVSTAYAALPITLCLIVYAFGAPCAIILAEHFTIQRVVIAGAFVGLIGIAISSLMVNMLYFTIIFGLSYGIGNSCFYGNGMIMLGNYFQKHRSFANGVALSGASIGQFVLPPLIEYLLSNFGLRGTMLVIAALYFHGAITGCLFRPIESYSVTETVKYADDGDAKERLVSEQNGHAKEDNLTPAHKDADFERKLIWKKGSKEEYDRFRKEVEEADDFQFVETQEKLSARMGSTGSIFLIAGSIPDLTANVRVKSKKAPVEEELRPCLRALYKVLDFRVMANYITLFYTIVTFLCFFGYFNFVLFLPSVVMEKGITSYDKAMIVSICGAGDLIARLAIGFFADLNVIERYKIKAIACLLCAIDILMFMFADSFAWLGVHSFLYGFFGGSYVCMVAVVMVDFVGLANMGKNLAVILFIQGIGSSAGQPFLGFLKDSTGSFDVITVTCTVSMGLGAILLFFYPVVCKLERQRQKRIQKHSGV